MSHQDSNIMKILEMGALPVWGPGHSMDFCQGATPVLNFWEQGLGFSSLDVQPPVHEDPKSWKASW